MRIGVKRVYEPPGPEGGYRVLVDRLWPRGVRRDDVRLDAWWRELAPSHALRRWSHADPAGRDEEFRRHYRYELAALPPAVREEVRAALQRPVVTLVTAARDPQRSHVAVLRRWLEELAAADLGPAP